MVSYHVQRCDELRKSQKRDDPKLGENWRIVLKFQDRHLYDVPEKENSKAESDEFHIANDEVYQDISLENNSIVNDLNQEDDTIIEYISDHEENEGNNSTNDDEVDSTFDGDDIGFD
ncbi:hypothetical protein H5410_042936, partial [Solanum commersonii]